MKTMLKNRDIIILALPKLNGDYTSTSASIAHELAKHNRVLWVENPLTWKDVFSYLIKGKGYKKLASIFRPNIHLTKHKSENVEMYVLTPSPILPINFLPKGSTYDSLAKLNHRILAKCIQEAINRLNFSEYTLINSHNFYYPHLSDYLQPILKVFHCVDGMLRKYSLRHGSYLERILLRKVDLAITTSVQLQKEKQVYQPNTHFIPNAADFNHCIKATYPETTIPTSLKQCSGVRLGFIGNIERRMDFELLAKVMKRNPTWHLFMIGPTMKSYIPDYFYSIPTVHFTGKIPYSQLPNYLKGLDVALIPYKKDKISRTIFPLKLYEYLGAGKAVVSTSFNPDALEDLHQVVYVADTPSSFESAIRVALATESEEEVEKRLAIAKENTWEERGKTFLTLLSENVEKEDAVTVY